ncbi:prion-inhibition and propagation-domain-containing protein [Xylaria longipes]|nr:prion-inhibition and propagation-domain-containing protein [Xylaria longipes]
MEAAGLGIGIVGLVGLFSSCLEITERWDFYKDSVAESASLKARLTADRIRFQQWGKSVGINSNGRYEHNHHKALDNPSIRSAIGLILQSIKDIDEDVDRLAPHLGHVSDSASLLPDENSHRLQSPKLPALSTRRSRIGWALRGRGRATMLVVSFETLVQKLHDLIPFEITPEGSRGGGAESSNAISSIEEANTSWHVDAQNILADLEKHIHNEVRKDLIDWLDAPDTQGTYHDRLERRLEGTCDWILDRPEFRHWQSPAQNTKILWINGPPGYGKTILAARIVEHLSVNPETSLAYFFWSETEYCVDPFAIMRAWVSQLIQTQEGFNLARERWEAANERTASKFDIKELFGTIVQYIPRCALVVDGLDECDTVNGNRAHRSSVSEFLNSLTGIALKSRARLLIVSRNELAIREGLRANSSEMKEQLVELQIVPNDVEADATLFSQSVVNKKLGNKTEAERKKLANELVNRCDSMFLGMKLLENDLRGGKNLKQLRKIIDEAPNKLDRIYDRNWERIQSFDESSRLRAFSILRWAAFSRRPLTVLEITEGLLLAYDKCEELDGEELDYEELPDSIDSIYIKTEILDLCVSLVEIRPGSTSDLSNSTVHLTHFSVREYILRHMPAYPTKLTANEQLRSSNNAIQNNIIAKACLRYLNCGRIWGETQPKENASPAIGAFRAYAAGSWQQHVEVNVDNTRDVMQLVNAFFRPANQNWQSWRKDIDSISRYMPIKYDGAIDTGNPLFYAALLGFGDTVDYLIDEMGLDVNHVDSSNRTALLAASSYGSLRATMHLLEKGANANIASNPLKRTDIHHCTWLLYAAMFK